MNTSKITRGTLLSIGLIFVFACAHAGTINVPGDYTTIQSAINNASSGDIIRVAAATYTENIILEPGVLLYGSGPDSTTIAAENSNLPTVRMAEGSRISGFRITGGYPAGISSDDVTADIINNVVTGNSLFGISLVADATDSEVRSRVINNTIADNTALPSQSFGIYIEPQGTNTIAAPIIMNNIITGHNFGISRYFPGTLPDPSDLPVIVWNDVWGNNDNYGYNYLPDPPGDISFDPLYADSDYHLSVGPPQSPCIDKGNPDSAYNDPDGTRNDMGAYGGPSVFGDLVAYYTFNDNADDQSGNGHDGDPRGPTLTYDTGLCSGDKAAQFGAGQYVELPDESDFDLTELTIVATINATNADVIKAIISKGPEFGNFTLRITRPPLKVSYVHLNASGGNWTPGSFSISADQFLHIAVTLDSNKFVYYLNGEIQLTYPSPPAPLLNDNLVTIGRYQFDAPGPVTQFLHFDGLIDDIRIYNRALTETEIKELVDLDCNGVPDYREAGPCAGQGGDTDGDTVCDNIDNCPTIANSSQTDSDTDGFGDACDPCPLDNENDVDTDGLCANFDRCPYDPLPLDPLQIDDGNHLDSDSDGLGDQCDNCPNTPNNDTLGTCVRYNKDGSGNKLSIAEIGRECPIPGCGPASEGWECNLSQEDLDEDRRGDACEDLSITLTVPDTSTVPVKKGEPIWSTLRIENPTTEPVQIITPTCFSCGAGPLFTVVDPATNKTLEQIYRIGPPILLPQYRTTIAPESYFEITCDINQMYLDRVLTDDPNIVGPTRYEVYATLSNGLEATEFGVEKYEYSSGLHDLYIEGTTNTYTANCTFDPDEWYAGWALAGGPNVVAEITLPEELDASNVDANSILLNGSERIVPGSFAPAGSTLTVAFNGPNAVQSFGSVAAGEKTATIQGEVLVNGETEYFQATGAVLLKGNFKLLVHRHFVGCGTHPGSYKEPEIDAYFKIFDKSEGSCVAGYGTSWKHWPDIWSECNEVLNGYTDYEGNAEVALGDGIWIILVEIEPNENILGKKLYVGRQIDNLSNQIVVEKYGQIIEKCDKKAVPAKGRKFKGSELWIIEPEYVEWSGESELYPFVFEGVGDWEVTTSVDFPEGFVSDNKALSEEVTNELKAVQFTITDVGTKWKRSKTKHKIKNKKNKKKEIFESEIGIMLTPELAKKKKVSKFGEEDDENGKKKRKNKKK